MVTSEDLKASSFFKDLPDAYLEKIAALCSEEEFQAQDIIVNEDDEANKRYDQVDLHGADQRHGLWGVRLRLWRRWLEQLDGVGLDSARGAWRTDRLGRVPVGGPHDRRLAGLGLPVGGGRVLPKQDQGPHPRGHLPSRGRHGH